MANPDHPDLRAAIRLEGTLAEVKNIIKGTSIGYLETGGVNFYASFQIT